MHVETRRHTQECGGLILGEKLEAGHQSLQQKARSISPQGDHLSRSNLPYSLPYSSSLNNKFMDIQFFFSSRLYPLQVKKS